MRFKKCARNSAQNAENKCARNSAQNAQNKCTRNSAQNAENKCAKICALEIVHLNSCHHNKCTQN